MGSGEAMASKPLLIRGTAIRAGTSRNLRLYLADELRKAADSLTGRPIYIEHVSADRAIGKVLRAWWDEGERAIRFEAEIYDGDVADKIRAGLIKHVSVAADYELLEPFDGVVPYGLSFQELSLVAVPGVPEANIEIIERSGGESQGPEAEEALSSEKREELEREREKRAQRYGIEIRPDGFLRPPKRFYEEGARSEEDYADPVNWRYPIHRPENVRAALAYWHRFRNRYKRQESRDIIFKRMVMAAIKYGIRPDWSKWSRFPEARALPEELKKAFSGYEATDGALSSSRARYKTASPSSAAIGGENMEEKVSVLPEGGGEGRFERIAGLLREALKSSDAAAAIPTAWIPSVVRRPAGLIANLGDVVRSYPQLKGRPGDKVRVPRLAGVEFTALTEGEAPTEPSLVLDGVEIALEEYGQLISITYSILEDMSSDIVAAIEEMFVEAAKLKEDEVILSKLEDMGSDELAAVLIAGDKASEDELTASDVLTPELIAKAVGAVLAKGYIVRPGDLTLVIHPKQYQDLLQNAQFTNAAALGSAEVVRTGRLTQYMGVNIVVSTKIPIGTSTDGTATYHAFVFHRDAIALAYKRDLTIEQERDIAARVLKLMATHRFGVKVVLPDAVVKLLTA
mgnify:CR=1 FL=1